MQASINCTLKTRNNSCFMKKNYLIFEVGGECVTLMPPWPLVSTSI